MAAAIERFKDVRQVRSFDATPAIRDRDVHLFPAVRQMPRHTETHPSALAAVFQRVGQQVRDRSTQGLLIAHDQWDVIANRDIGLRMRGGEADLGKAAKVLLQDYRDGLLGRVSLETPMTRSVMLAAELGQTENPQLAPDRDLPAGPETDE